MEVIVQALHWVNGTIMMFDIQQEEPKSDYFPLLLSS